MATRTRSVPRATGALLTLLLLVVTSACLPKEEQSILDRTNALRAANGVAPLKEHSTLTAKAEWWAQHMAGTGSLQHSTLTAGLDGLSWRYLAENVAVSAPTADTLRTIFELLASSPTHRANMLDRRYTHIGIGVAKGPDGRVWVVQEFAAL